MKFASLGEIDSIDQIPYADQQPVQWPQHRPAGKDGQVTVTYFTHGFIGTAYDSWSPLLLQVQSLLGLLLPHFARQFSAAAGTGARSEPAADLKGQIFCVTGSTSGLGRVTAALLAQCNATVLIHGRDTEVVRREITSLRQATGNHSLYGYGYDLSSMAQTRRFAAHLARDLEQFFGNGKLAALVNNAAVYREDVAVTEDGLGETWAVNTAAPFLLTGSLLAAGLIGGRVVNVSSITMARSLDFAAVEQGYQRGGVEAYAVSKLALNMFTYRLARLLDGVSPVAVNCIDPGTAHTKLLFAMWGEAADPAMKAQEARDEFWAATEPRLGVVAGRYYVNRKARDSPAFSYDKRAQQRLWACLERQTGWAFPASSP